MVHHRTKQQTPLSEPLQKQYRYSVFRTIEAAGGDWDAAAPPDNLFLQRRYLSVMEHQPPDGMRFSYLVFYEGNTPIGVALMQIKHFSAENNIKSEEKEEKEPCFFTVLANWLKKQVASRVTGDILISGNMLLSGEHGYYFAPGSIGKKERIELLEKACNQVLQNFEQEGTRIPVILIKDVAMEHQEQGRYLLEKSFVEFDIQPCMTMELPYSDFDAYLESMSTKYRTRAKRAFKKGKDLEKKELSLLEIQRELPRLYALYKDIARNAGFNMVDLNEQYLLALKRDLGDHYRLFAYYYEGNLVAFYTTIYNHGELEAHFLGYEKERNHDLQIYLNILYDIIRVGIDSRSHSIMFARTALEIKSSVGAIPNAYLCYLRHQNSLTNRFTGTMLDYFKPTEDWKQRHPFKSGAEGDDPDA